MTDHDPALLGRRGLLGATASLLAVPAALAQTAPPAAAPATAPQSAVITVNQARTEPIPIAIPNFPGADDQMSALGAQITGVISDDLSRSGLFKAISQQAFIGNDTGDVPNFSNWSSVGANALVTGKLLDAGNGQLRVEFRLWDVLPQTQIQGTAYTTQPSNWRRIAHIIADVVYQRLLGESGYFDTRIVYVADSGPLLHRTKRLAIMDQDGANNRFLTDGTWMVLTPRWHPTRDEIAFMSYNNNRPRVYTFNLGNGEQAVLGEFEGMTFAPRFSPDGNSIIMSVTNGGGSDIVTVDLSSGARNRFASSGAIDTSPCYSPDGTQICFESDRGGDQQIYVMDSSGNNVKRISFGDGRYGTPVWSPRGDLIAFTKPSSNSSPFSIGVMEPDGSNERILSEGFDVEGPSFAPNGRVLTFWRQNPSLNSYGSGYSERLVTIDIEGFNERVIDTPTDASAPAWSPLNT